MFTLKSDLEIMTIRFENDYVLFKEWMIVEFKDIISAFVSIQVMILNIILYYVLY